MATQDRTALTKTLRDGRTAVVTVTLDDHDGYRHPSVSASVAIDGKDTGTQHLGPHHRAPREALAAAGPGYTAAIGPLLLLTAGEAAQIETVYRELAAAVPPDLDFRRGQLVSALDGAEQESGIRAAERLDAGYADPFAGNGECEQRITEAREALAAFDREHPEAAARAAGRREEAVRRALEGRD